VQATVLVPVKRLADAKTRLGPALTPDGRRALMTALLEHALAVLGDTPAVGRVAVATSDEEVAAVAARSGAAAIDDGGLPWNDGLLHAAGQLSPAPRLLAIVAADLPLLRAADVEGLIDAAPEGGIAIARARDGGTNALALRPPDGFVPNFGLPQSARVHAERARAAGREARIVDLPTLALDLDTVEDARACLALGGRGGVVDLLRALLAPRAAARQAG
jgi:2-phospho-L-lactate guanylyltransferase